MLNKPRTSTTNKPNHSHTTKPQLIHPKKSKIIELLTNNLTENDAQTTTTYIQNLESQLIHSQRLGYLGQFTSEIIHEFNNILGGILGYTTLLKNQLDPKSDTYQYTTTIEQSSQRGTQLTQQLLNASRKETHNKKLNINNIITDVHNILSKTLKKDIEFKINTQENLPTVQGNQAQIHQVLLNLCINASDAIKNKGTITITTKTTPNKQLTKNQNQPSKQHTYIKLTITDNGSGIIPSIQNNIFEPFFTTKQENKGTGLGLTITKAILDNHNSSITFKTTPKKGTKFTILFPIKTKPNNSTQKITDPKKLSKKT